MSRIKIWLASTLITLAVIGSGIYAWPNSTHEITRASPGATNVENKPLQRSEGTPSLSELTNPQNNQNEEAPILIGLDINRVERGDQYLLVGNYDGAQREYIKATKERLKDQPATLLLRLALTAEKMGDTKQSNLLYQKAIQRAADGSVVQILGLTGIARIWQTNGQLAQSHELLAELFLRYASSEQLHDEVRFQIMYQLSSVTQQRYLAGRSQPQHEMDSLEFLWLGPSIDAMIEILLEHGDETNQLDFDSSQPLQVVVLQRPSPDVNLIAVDSTASLMPIDEILQQYSQQATIGFEFSNMAREVIKGRLSRLAVSGLPLAMVLDQLLSPLGLVWIQNNETISIYGETESDIESQKYLAQMTERTLRNIELSFSRGIRRNSSLLHRGNLSFISGDIDTAANRYAELEKLLPNGELAAKLGFNYGVVEFVNGDLESAIKRLFYAVDQSLNLALQAKSYAWIGRLELKQGRADRAVYALSRGLSLAQNAQVRQDALMNLAKSYLLESDPFSANRILFNHAESVIDLSEKKKAAVFSAYARYLGMVPSEGLRNEGERMVVALATITPEDASGFVDRLLIGRAFFEVGFNSRATEFLQLALEIAPNNYWRRRVSFELATILYRSGELSAAAEHFSLLLQGEPDVSSLLAQIKLADIALSQNKPEQCLETCKDIWKQNISDDQKAKTLSMMGQAYQRLGRHHVAAIYFSGMVPHETGINATSNTMPSPTQNTANQVIQ